MNYVGEIINSRYRVIEKIGEGGMSVVWLAFDTTCKNNVAVKIMKKGSTSRKLEDVIRFRNEANIVSRLDVPGIVKIYEIGEVENNHYIVMEYIEGKSLLELIKDGSKLDINYSVEIFKRICEALKYIHDSNVIHRDLKPANILIDNRDELNVKLIDFGLAQIKELDINDTKEIVGTLCYMSPEQSGATKRNVDERSDLYSLGVILYQMLTYELPFNGESINTIIHQHIAKVPEKLTNINSNIPKILEKIVLKLLEKEPENRYQSIDGLLNDINKYISGHKDFILGMDDTKIKLNFRSKLVGREEELESIKSMYDKASNGEGGICFISGEAGSGKTRLVEELRNYTNKKDGVFINGKCFSGKNKVPYGPIKDAMNIYLERYNKLPIQKRKEIKENISKHAGELGGIILKINPMMEEILGKCPPLVELEPDKENIRFLMNMIKFFSSLARVENVLVIMIDDLHWSDEGTIELLKNWSSQISNVPILIIGTYRNNEIDEKSKLYALEKSLEINCNFFNKIQLRQFDLKRMIIFISNILYSQSGDLNEISEFILHKSSGNALFAIEILRRLIDKEVIYRKENKWIVNYEILKKTDIPSTIVDALINKISILSQKETYILSFAAAIGKKFEIELLFLLCDFIKDEIVEVVDKAISLQILEKDYFDGRKTVFTHDRIREAFYKNIENEKKKGLHHKIAETIEEINKKEIDKVIFDLAYHYSECECNNKIIEYAYLAGIESKNNYANEDAINYLLQVNRLLEINGQIDSEKWVLCYEAIGEIYLNIGKNDEAIKIFDELLKHMKSSLEKAKIFQKICAAYQRKGEYKNCELYAKDGLALLGENMALSGFSVNISLIKELFINLVLKAIPIKLYCKKGSDKEKEYKLIVLFYLSLNSAYVISDLVKFTNSMLRVMNIAQVRLGTSKETAICLRGYGGLLMAIPLFKLGEKYHFKALKMAKEMDDEWGIAQTNQFLGYLYAWSGRYNQSVEYLEKSKEIFERIGDSKELAMSYSALWHAYFYSSDYKNALSVTDSYYEIADKSKDKYGIGSSLLFYGYIHLEMGDIQKALEYIIKTYYFSYKNKDWFNHFACSLLLSIYFLENNELARAEKYFYKTNILSKKGLYISFYTVAYYQYYAEFLISKYEYSKNEISNAEKKNLVKNIKKACIKAIKKTRDWPPFNASSIRCMAKYNELIGKHENAKKLFNKSIEMSSKYGRKYDIAKTLYEYGMFLKNNGQKEEARKNLESSYSIFKEIDAATYESKIAEILGIDKEGESTEERFARELNTQRRLSSIYSLSQGISSILDLDTLADKILEIAMQTTGAHRGLLILIEEGSNNYRIFANKSINEYKEKIENYSKHIVEEVIKKGDVIITTNAMEDERYNSYESVVYNELKSVLCIPIKYNNIITGVCYFDNSLSTSVFSYEDVDLLNAIMNQAAISIENAKLFKIAITDGLTDLYTHKHFMFLLGNEIERCKRFNKEFSLIMFDIDHFKKFNDNYGHQAGDKVLKSISKLVKNVCRDIDIIARYGGEEFAIIIPEMEKVQASDLGEKIRLAVENKDVIFEDKVLKVTISIGIATFPEHSDDLENLIKAADSALYRSKDKGRNTITVYN